MKDITYFSTVAELRQWLADNHAQAHALQVGFYKKQSVQFNFSWSEAVDAAICFGWIDGVRHGVDGESYTVRFTPRKANSIWSAVNLKKVEELTKRGLMHPAGIAAYERRSAEKSKIYAYEQQNAALAEADEAKFRENAKAWEFFTAQAPSYRKTAI